MNVFLIIIFLFTCTNMISYKTAMLAVTVTDRGAKANTSSMKARTIIEV